MRLSSVAASVRVVRDREKSVKRKEKRGKMSVIIRNVSVAPPNHASAREMLPLAATHVSVVYRRRLKWGLFLPVVMDAEPTFHLDKTRNHGPE